jgi:hypothetical protein
MYCALLVLHQSQMLTYAYTTTNPLVANVQIERWCSVMYLYVRWSRMTHVRSQEEGLRRPMGKLNNRGVVSCVRAATCRLAPLDGATSMNGPARNE